MKNFTDRMIIVKNNLKEMTRRGNCVNINDLYEYCGYPYNFKQSLQGLEKAGVITINGDRISLK